MARQLGLTTKYYASRLGPLPPLARSGPDQFALKSAETAQTDLTDEPWTLSL